VKIEDLKATYSKGDVRYVRLTGVMDSIPAFCMSENSRDEPIVSVDYIGEGAKLMVLKMGKDPDSDLPAVFYKIDGEYGEFWTPRAVFAKYTVGAEEWKLIQREWLKGLKGRDSK
jgi:hypothetical protein